MPIITKLDKPFKYKLDGTTFTLRALKADEREAIESQYPEPTLKDQEGIIDTTLKVGIVTWSNATRVEVDDAGNLKAYPQPYDVELIASFPLSTKIALFKAITGQAEAFARFDTAEGKG